MTTDRHAVLEKFAKLKTPSSGSSRRVDYKGDRRRLNLRISPALTIDLAVIKLVTGEHKNDFCERVLAAAIQATINELKGRHDHAAWEAITRLASPRRK